MSQQLAKAEKEIRLNKFLSHNTKYSRREADKLIESGRVEVNGKVVTDLSTKVKEGDKVKLNGRYIKPKSMHEMTVIVYHKPKGELVTKKDPKGRKTIYDSLPKRYAHFVPIGRLDFASEGLLLLTDSPRVADILMRSNLERVYNLKIRGSITHAMEKAMQEGMKIRGKKGAHEKSTIEEMEFAPFFAYQILKNESNYSKIRVAIGEGKNRELRRFFGHFDREVLDLHRISFGGISLNNLPKGKTRYLSQKEYDDLHAFIKAQQEAEYLTRKETKNREEEENS
ncbi:pseudouridine synthase [Hydrogenimonas cancrithermarum]|uniref:Pseudouridine synthase n=1 Tax=Hydrogenimonas cancrithermarum TaxID=2993563 RepID=A0ABM8FLH1_9BACT|nr:pseudouridine synthase [Hydrogenimonas cancrithermarum]BDY13139.1 putative RNA pseudouridine synthase [Hydrogenimonas cancrithermarum]